MPQETTDDRAMIEAVRARLLAAASAERARVRFSDRFAGGIGKKIPAGLDAGRAALEEERDAFGSAPP